MQELRRWRSHKGMLASEVATLPIAPQCYPLISAFLSGEFAVVLSDPKGMCELQKVWENEIQKYLDAKFLFKNLCIFL